MKTKALFLIIIFLLGMFALSESLQANVDQKVVVKDIEYLTGDDFVQLYFKIGQMIPIPDVYYPDKNDNTRIVMSMKDVTFAIQQEQINFESPIINGVKINRDKSKRNVDIEIQLMEQVNYRVFTNQKGLFIEFPVVKHIKSTFDSKKLTSATVVENQSVVDSKPVAPVGQKIVKSDVKNGAEFKPVVSKGKRVRLKDIIVCEKHPNCVKFKILMKGNGIPNYTVIPIPDAPTRLAIDFKDTTSRPIKKSINLLNVKRIRGAYNSSSIYRVVFDLDYLKKYKVSQRPDNKGLEVEFFNEDFELAQASKVKNPSNNSNSPNETPVEVEVKEQGVVLSNNPQPTENLIVEVKGNQIQSNQSESKQLSNPAQLPSDDGELVEIETPKNSENGDMVVSNYVDDGTLPDGVTVSINNDQNSPVTNLSQNDFFEDEKSQVSNQENLGSNEDSDDSKPSKNVFVRKTIDGGETEYKGEPITFNFHDADLRDVINSIAKIAGLNIVLDPGVSGKVTSQLTQVPWDQALELFLKINDLDMVQEGNIVRIGRVQDLADEAERRRKLREAKQMEGELTVFTRTLSFAKVDEAAKIIKKQLSSRGEIIEDERSNTLIISEVPSRIDLIDKLIDTLDTANPQVSIEARIVESNANFIESIGVQWGYNFIADAAYGNQTTLKFPNSVGAYGTQFTSETSPLLGPLGGYAVNLPASGATSGTVFTLGNIANTFRLDMALSAMQSKGEGRIISAPKTTTQNNMEAHIMQGKQIPVQIIQNNTVTVQYRPAALELKVTPQITAEGTIITELEINNNSADFGNLVNGIPPITTQSIKTTVQVTDGGTIVIGGMYRVEESTTKEGVPFLNKIPILGSLFRNKSARKEQKELLIFITPRIVR